ncbi:hypothetical protein NPIL_222231 [Nephila pilipes]|uniref:Uncharacterized protein n=1 Tax=Nephila pilipes TaxID=299642 RepID=A0A8X6MNM6_NEPPI|nr:hypothetical protein NPIL_222231 [Nephila pilipes]
MQIYEWRSVRQHLPNYGKINTRNTDKHATSVRQHASFIRWGDHRKQNLRAHKLHLPVTPDFEFHQHLNCFNSKMYNYHHDDNRRLYQYDSQEHLWASFNTSSDISKYRASLQALLSCGRNRNLETFSGIVSDERLASIRRLHPSVLEESLLVMQAADRDRVFSMVRNPSFVDVHVSLNRISCRLPSIIAEIQKLASMSENIGRSYADTDKGGQLGAQRSRLFTNISC